MTAALEGGEWSAARLGRTLPPGKTRYPFYRRLGGPQGRSGRAENLVPTGIFLISLLFKTPCVHSNTNCNRYYRHHPGTQSVHISRDIITPHSTEHFDPPLLLNTIPVIHFLHTTLPPHFALHRKARWHNLRAMYRTDYVRPPPTGPVFA